jgi:hypothetical protein
MFRAGGVSQHGKSNDPSARPGDALEDASNVHCPYCRMSVEYYSPVLRRTLRLPDGVNATSSVPAAHPTSDIKSGILRLEVLSA